MKRLTLICLIVLFLTGCATVSKPYVKPHQDPDVDSDKYPKYYVSQVHDSEDISMEDILIYKNLNNIVKDRLAKKGYILTDNPKDADVHVFTFFTNEYKRHYFPSPPQTHTPLTCTEKTNSCCDSNIGTGQAITQKTSSPHVRTKSPYVVYFYPSIRISMLDNKQAKEYYERDERIEKAFFWSSETTDSTKESDIIKSAPRLIDLIFKQLPDRENKEEQGGKNFGKRPKNQRKDKKHLY